MKHKNVAYIDTSAFGKNYRAVCDAVRRGFECGRCERVPVVISVVKADAYGHGISLAASALGNAGCSFFAVSSEEEAMELRKIEEGNGRYPEILILGHIMPENAREMAENGVACAAVSYENAIELDRAMRSSGCGDGVRLKIHVKLDTGMNRVGFPADEESLADTVEKIREVAAMRGVQMTGIFTHFSCADIDLHDAALHNYTEKTYTDVQLERYCAVVNALEQAGIDVGMRHAANSAAILGLPEAYFDAVRAGIILYGYSPSGDVEEAKRVGLVPAMRFDSTVVHIHRILAGDRVSYGGTFEAPHDMTVATIAAGYADGYERAYAGCEVKIGQASCRSLGRICMDQFMVDITGREQEIQIGDAATLFGGDDGTMIEHLAAAAGTINYEVVCKVSKRVPRVGV